jgi:hypothetical protein
MHHHFFTPVPDVSVARSDVPPELTAVLGRILTKDPAHRYPTTRDMLAAVEAIPLGEADRREGEAMLRELANGSPVRTIATAALPPLADTMTVVVAQDSQRRSAEHRLRRRRITASVLAAVAIGGAVAAGISSRRSPASASTVKPSPSAVTPPSTTVIPAPAPAPVVAGPTHADSVRSARMRAESAKARNAIAARPGLAAESVVPAGPPPAGKLRVRILPADAAIYVDGRLLGNGAVIDSTLPVGARNLHVVAGGYKSYDTVVMVRPDSTTVLGTVVLKPEP